MFIPSQEKEAFSFVKNQDSLDAIMYKIFTSDYGCVKFLYEKDLLWLGSHFVNLWFFAVEIHVFLVYWKTNENIIVLANHFSIPSFRNFRQNFG